LIALADIQFNGSPARYGLMVILAFQRLDIKLLNKFLDVNVFL
jgi:hypothetical protein